MAAAGAARVLVLLVLNPRTYTLAEGVPQPPQQNPRRRQRHDCLLCPASLRVMETVAMKALGGRWLASVRVVAEMLAALALTSASACVRSWERSGSRL